jgi:hypothetical protein
VPGKQQSRTLAPEQIRGRLESALMSAKNPVLAEEGEQPLPLKPEQVTFTIHAGKLVLEAWGDTANLRRRIVGIAYEKPGVLALLAERFGGRPCRLLLYDRARPAAPQLDRRSDRMVRRERFRLLLKRHYPDWRVVEVSSDPDLENSLSPVYPRAFLKKGGAGWAAILAPEAPERADGVLSFGLIWLDYLRRRERKVSVDGLALFLPAGQENTTCLRLSCLNPAAFQASVFLYNSQDDWPVDPTRHGNLVTVLEPADQVQPSGAAGGPVARREAPNRANPRLVDARLDPAPVYGQVPALAGIQRGILDLLAIDSHGRLAVIELKATADLHLPLQALDYWMRVRWHAERGDFSRQGYFPKKVVLPVAPRLLLVAPAFEFHSSTETLLRYLQAGIEVERVGLGLEWQRDFIVAFRLRGARRPA